MPSFSMSKDQILSLKVLDIKENVKQINGKKTSYRHDILLEDKSGNTMKGEYLTSAPEYDGAFVKGVMQFVKCVAVSNFPETGGEAYIIAPVQDREPSKLEKAKSIVDNIPKSDPSKVTCYTRAVAGTSISFSAGYAKDILVARIAAGQVTEVTENTIKEMMGWADIINDRICDRIDF